MILHTVLFSLMPSTSQSQLDQVLTALSDLTQVCEGMLSFEAGPNLDLERKSQDYSHGFLARFRDQDALERYAVHPAHRAAGAALVTICKDGADGIMVVDLEI